jgi:tetratricopeptide (TPR) repeat protein
MPYRPMQRLFRHTIGLPDDVEDEALAAVITELTAGTAPDLMPWLPLIGVAAGVDLPSTPELDALDPKIRKARLETVVSDLLGRLLTTPIVMVFNDLYLMDDATIDLLKRLAADVGDRPWLIVATRRPGTPSPFAKETASKSLRVTKVELQPLSMQAATDFLVSANSDVPLPPHQLRRLAERAGGNPLFLRELVAGARAGSIEALPDSVEGVIAMRIDQLMPEQRRWLRSASVLGMTVDTSLLAAALEDPKAADPDFVDGLHEFVVAGADGKLRFTHHLTRATAYEGLPYRRRTSLHATTAELIEQRAAGREEQAAELLSVHCFHGELYERAWRFSRIAGYRARDHYALPEAAECLDRAITSADHLDDREPAEVAAVEEALAGVYVDLGEFTEAERVLVRGRRRVVADIYWLARMQLLTAKTRDAAGRYDDALRWVTRGRQTLKGRADVESVLVLARLADAAASSRYRQGKFGSSIRWARRTADEGLRAGSRRLHARGLEWSAMAAAAAGLPWDDESFRSAVAIYDELGDLVAKAAALNRHGACSYYAGRWDDAVRLYIEAEKAYWRSGREYDAATNAANRAEVLIQQGHLDDVDEIISAATKVWLSTGNMSAMAFGMTLLGQAELARGEFAEALGHLAEARMLCVGLGEVDEVATIDSVIALTQLEGGDPTSALETAITALDSTGRTSGPGTPLLLRVRGQALIALGKRVKGQAMLRASLDDARRRDAKHEVAAALDALLGADAWTNAAERSAWTYEHNSLVNGLGIVQGTDTDVGLASIG